MFAQPNSINTDLNTDLINFLIYKYQLPNDTLSFNIAVDMYEISNNEKFNNFNGIFSFKSFSSHSTFYLLTWYKTEYEIIDTDKTFKNTILKILNYCQLNKDVDKQKLINYVEKIIEVYNLNKEYSPWVTKD